VARAGAPGARPGRAVRELHLRVRARPGHDPAFAARLSTLPLRRPSQPLPGEGARRHARAPAATGRAGVVRLLRYGANERTGDGTARPRSPARGRRRADARLSDPRRDPGPAGRGLFHGPTGAECPDRVGCGARPGGRPHGLRGRARGHGRGLARHGCRARGGAAARHAHGRAKRDPPRRHRIARPPAGLALDGVTRLVDVPSQFAYRSFDQVAGAFAEAATAGERLLFDAHAAEWASPYGLVGLLVAGQAARGTGHGGGGAGGGPLRNAPAHADTLAYLRRARVLPGTAE